MTTIQPEDRDGFEKHASPETVAVHLGRAKAALRRAQREVEWLSTLLGRRAAEQAAGVWPHPEGDDA